MAGLAGWVGNRKVSTKVLTVAAVAIAGTVVTGAVSLAGISGLQSTRTQELSRAVPYINELNSAALAAKAAANDERGYLIAGDTKFRDEALGRQKTVNVDLAGARSRGTASERATIDEIQKAMDAWFAALQAEFTTYESDHEAAVKAAFGPNRELRKTYETKLAAEISRANDALVAGKDFDATVRATRWSIGVVFAIAVALAVLLALFIARQIVAPLGRVSRVLQAVADGDLSHDPDVNQKDELGKMADMLRQAIGTLRQTVTELSEHSTTLGGAAQNLSDTSRHCVTDAQEGARQSAAVADSAATMSTNIHTVAAGAEEMGASIREIGQSATHAAGVAARAVEVTADTSTVIARLGESSTQIGNVVNVITSIAEQTNLLALNATIEAARAGDMGKGFAVVAGEVKDLAQETARATQDIGQRVAAIQEDTAGAVAAIAEISEIIGRISEFQTTIASAVEEQTVTTSEMTRNVTEAASAGGAVAQTIDDVAGAVGRINSRVDGASQAAGQLATMSADLRRIVDRFQL
ncbi:methyl-accepting chemotaxis protein [Krasilnikovia cinnamomea]|uniref:Methyl-accepting chemotaxis protein n=1 Tax=Krasilnikovia cinnamomea TaxID=349313 RepID=A0A4Q7ZT87_9ACTN|nr:methyl-accepting chemotaxis protein [Krasilnikovia cinnamomea]RZU54430.1 methyl-accepting chemotaxis protein [Krasilnikovia cinnamomea]